MWGNDMENLDIRNPKEHTHNAIMRCGKETMSLKVSIDDENVYFLRDKSGVHAWHCNSLPKDHFDILKITPNPL